MRLLAVVAERLAVIGGDGDEVSGVARLNEAADQPIDRGDLAVVRRRGEPRLQIRRRIVRIVRIEQVHPQERTARPAGRGLLASHASARVTTSSPRRSTVRYRSSPGRRSRKPAS